MTRAPEVSVLMAVYNGQSHVREAIDGILSQTFRAFEFIIVNDGSTDETARILDECDDPRIVRLDHARNQGLIAALNTGLGAASGEYVARQDADDVSFPGRLQAQVDFLRSRPDIGVLGSAWDYEPVAGGARTTRSLERDPLRLAWMLLFRCPLPHCSVMFRRKLIQDLGGYGKDDLFVEDYALWSKVARSSRVANLAQTLVVRRRPPGSITARYAAEMGMAARRVSLQNLRWASDASIPDARLDALQALVGNRGLTLTEALALESRGLRTAVSRLLAGFGLRMGLDSETLPEFRAWALAWIGRALLRRSRGLLNQSAASKGPEKRLGQRLARALAVDAVRLSPGLLSQPGGAFVALRALMSRA